MKGRIILWESRPRWPPESAPGFNSRLWSGASRNSWFRRPTVTKIAIISTTLIVAFRPDFQQKFQKCFYSNRAREGRKGNKQELHQKLSLPWIAGQRSPIECFADQSPEKSLEYCLEFLPLAVPPCPPKTRNSRCSGANFIQVVLFLPDPRKDRMLRNTCSLLCFVHTGQSSNQRRRGFVLSKRIFHSVCCLEFGFVCLLMTLLNASLHSCQTGNCASRRIVMKRALFSWAEIRSKSLEPRLW